MKIQKNIPLAPMTTLKIGGPAKFFCEVSSEEEILEAISYARKNNLEIFILSGGSNILVSDSGFSGLVIKMLNTKCRVSDNSIQCGAGLLLLKVVDLAKENSLAGLEWAAGIPGTIGGAVRGNAGAYGKEIKDFLELVNYINIKKEAPAVLKMNASECRFSYRNSIFKENKNLVIFSCTLKLKKGNNDEIENKMKEVIKKRAQKLPRELSAGSFFENPKVENQNLIRRFEKETNVHVSDSRLPAGWLIEDLGLKGKKIGGVMVSEKHANFVINLGRGKAEDVVMLSSFIKQQVRSKLGVQLKEEVQYVGF